MRLTICVAAALILSASSAQLAAKPAPFDIKHTSWSFVDNKTRVHESIDADGNYIENAVSGKHIDHGTGVMKDGKACFTSAMTKDGEICWTTKPVKVGHSMQTTNDKGEKLTVTRVAYSPLHMPK